MLVTLGTLTALCNFLDRSILNILAEPIKRDLNFSDTQLGLLTGFAFALFYSVMALPIARFADRPETNRPRLIAICVALWSAMTMACGAVTSYGQLLGARVLVAIGESGAGPAVVTLMDEQVPPARRSRYFAIYGLGVPLGTLCGLLIGGWVVDLFNWRIAFLVVGAPGLLLALAVKLLLGEPREMNKRTMSTGGTGVADVFRTIARSPALCWLLAGNAMSGLFAVGLPSWSGVYLIRLLHLSPAHAGTLLGLLIGVGGGLGTYAGGMLADRLSARRPGRALLAPVIGLVILVPAGILALSSNDWRVFAIFYVIAACGASAYIGPLFSTLQRLAGQRHRASVVVVAVMLFNVVGAGIGPLLIGYASDLLSNSAGAAGLRWAMIVAYSTGVLAALLYARAMILVNGELAE